MELYILDALLRREWVVDVFESLTWAERSADHGEFELNIKSTPGLKKRVRLGSRLSTNVSTRIMMVETLDEAEDEDGRIMLKVTGRSVEALLKDRAFRYLDVATNYDANPAYEAFATPTSVANIVTRETVAASHADDPLDVIPFLIMANLADYHYPPGNIPEPPEWILRSIEPGVLFDIIKDIADSYDFGFRLTNPPNESKLYMDFYMGDDRTSSQINHPAVIFAPELENLKSVNEYHTSEGQKNVAVVHTKYREYVIFPSDVDPEIDGFDRKVLFIKADDIDTENLVEEETLATQKGLEELNKNRAFSALGGRVDEYSAYKYEVDYFLGDIVELRDSEGVTSRMRVSEQIFISDEEGDRSYPTLTVNMFITPGSWVAWNYNQHWEDMGATEYWDTMP